MEFIINSILLLLGYFLLAYSLFLVDKNIDLDSIESFIKELVGILGYLILLGVLYLGGFFVIIVWFAYTTLILTPRILSNLGLAG